MTPLLQCPRSLVFLHVVISNDPLLATWNLELQCPQNVAAVVGLPRSRARTGVQVVNLGAGQTCGTR